MNEEFSNITIAPILADSLALIIYRDNGEEILAKINKENKTIASEKKLSPDEVNCIKENYF